MQYYDLFSLRTSFVEVQVPSLFYIMKHDLLHTDNSSIECFVVRLSHAGRCWLQQWIMSSTVINNAEWKWWYKCWYCHPSKNIFLWIASNLLSRKKCISACISSVNILFLLCIIGLGMKRFKRFVSWRVGRWSPSPWLDDNAISYLPRKPMLNERGLHSVSFRDSMFAQSSYEPLF